MLVKKEKLMVTERLRTRPANRDELPVPSNTAVFRGLLDAQEKHGYQNGYRAAVIDLIGSLSGLTADFVRHHSRHDSDARLTVEEFETYIRRHLLSSNTD